MIASTPTRLVLLQCAVLNLHNAAACASHGRGVASIQCLLAARRCLLEALEQR